ncbi:MAG: DUF3084 domain-containing protein [Cyanobacteria bacterium P01_A01_bin.105]
MDVGLILIATVLFLGGMIATLGDRIGMRVGKARLSLFNLRPRQTATVVSVVTGSVISASTLGLLLVASDRLRQGIFEFEETQQNLSQARRSLEEAQQAKSDIETALETVTEQQRAAEAELSAVETDLSAVVAARDEAIDRENAAVDREAAAVAREQDIQSRLTTTESQLSTVSQQSEQLRTDIRQLQQERQALVQREADIRRQIAQRDRDIQQRNQALAVRDREIAAREAQLTQLETQQVNLAKQIEQLEAEFVKLRGGSVAVSRNQTLALLVTRADSPDVAASQVQQALVDANRLALRSIVPNAATDFQILRVGPEVVDTVVQQIDDGQLYALRVASAGNYIVGEPCVIEGGDPCLEVSIQAQVNRLVFEPGETISAISIDEAFLPSTVLLDRLGTLLLTAQVQASLEGVIILENPLLEGRLSEPTIEFLRQVQNYGEPLQIEAVALRPIYTTGPLYFDLVATRNGVPVFRAEL